MDLDQKVLQVFIIGGIRIRRENVNVLYVSISFPKEEEGRNLYTDLAQEIAKKHSITVLATEEKKKIQKTQINKERDIEVIRVKVGNMYNVSLIEKAISYITLPYFVNKTIKKELNDRKYDMILYTAPPITIGKIVKYAKQKFNCMSYLMQKDIFPDNAVDIGIMKKNSLPYIYFKRKEKELYKISDKIGCMSEKNKTYIRENNNDIKDLSKKLEYFPNTVMLKDKSEQRDIKRIKEKYKIPENKIIALYGGNFGKPQGINYIIDVLKFYKDNNDVFFVFVGKGTEKDRLTHEIEKNQIKNALILDYVPSQEYTQFLQIADIGLIFLDKRFTIPNIPSRLLSYLEYSIPILAATDKNTDLHEILEDNNIGVWCESDKIEGFAERMNYYMEDEKRRKQIGQNGRKYLEENLTTKKSIEILENTYKKNI